MATENLGLRPGIYSVDYFSSSQVAVYIGDIYIDEVTSLQFTVQQNRRPLYGYADQFFRAMSKGQILVQGMFSVNFKEAGYLWLVLDNYKRLIERKKSPFTDTDSVYQQNIERLVNGEVKSATERTEAYKTLSEAYASLAGYADVTRAENRFTQNENQYVITTGKYNVGAAENAFETFENAIWQKPTNELITENRRCDDVDLNPFDIYISYGDFANDDTMNHTIVKLSDVYIIGTSQQMEMDNLPLQEAYHFIARTRL